MDHVVHCCVLNAQATEPLGTGHWFCSMGRSSWPAGQSVNMYSEELESKRETGRALRAAALVEYGGCVLAARLPDVIKAHVAAAVGLESGPRPAGCCVRKLRIHLHGWLSSPLMHDASQVAAWPAYLLTNSDCEDLRAFAPFGLACRPLKEQRQDLGRCCCGNAEQSQYPKAPEPELSSYTLRRIKGCTRHRAWMLSRSARSARPRAASLALNEATRMKRMLGIDTHPCVGRVPGHAGVVCFLSTVDACFNSVYWRQM